MQQCYNADKDVDKQHLYKSVAHVDLYILDSSEMVITI
jgi:hypothetical protein